MQADPLNALRKTTETGTSTDITNTPEVETAVEYPSELCYDDALMVQGFVVLSAPIFIFIIILIHIRSNLLVCLLNMCFNVRIRKSDLWYKGVNYGHC